MADELDRGQASGEVRGAGNPQLPEARGIGISELGVSSQRLSEWRETRDAGPEVVEHLIKRKEIYEWWRPEAKAGVAGGKASGVARGTTADSAVVQSFAADTAAKTGTSERTIRESIRRAKKIDPGQSRGSRADRDYRGATGSRGRTGIPGSLWCGNSLRTR
jgi:hypothetical protein